VAAAGVGATSAAADEDVGAIKPTVALACTVAVEAGAAAAPDTADAHTAGTEATAIAARAREAVLTADIPDSFPQMTFATPG
jgi:hypothetical protein